MESESLPVTSQTNKLRFIKSPIHNPDDGEPNEHHDASTSRSTTDTLPGGITRPRNPPAMELIGYRYRPEDTPWLRRNDDATNLEVLYDLFLACLNLFNRNQRMDSLDGLSAYIGFFCLMWTTWFLTSSYDVRFLTDSIFERCCRAVHLGVLVGFVVISPNFNLSRQDSSVLQTFSIILMISRLCLMVEYAAIFVQAWHYKGKWHLAIMASINLVNSVVYLVISNRFKEIENDRLFITWYATCGCEIFSVILTSVSYPILSFQGTPIIKRLSLLTLIIFGEGITVACSNITDIIGTDGYEAWSPNLIGVVTACIAITYLAFMLYFDTLQNFHLPPWRQHAWTILHFPLHLTLTLFTEGCAQFIVFWKVFELEAATLHDWDGVIRDSLRPDQTDFSAPYRAWIDDFFSEQPPLYYAYRTGMNDSLDDIAAVGPSTRDALRSAVDAASTSQLEALVAEDPAAERALNAMSALVYTALNVLFAQNGLDYAEDEVTGRNITDAAQAADIITSFDFSSDTTLRVFNRMMVVFQYTFVCCGVFLALLALVAGLGRTTPWSGWVVVRTVITLLAALAVGMVAYVSSDKLRMTIYISTPWVLPPIVVLFFLLLVMLHIPEHWISFRRGFAWVRAKIRRKGEPDRGGDREKGPGGEGEGSSQTLETCVDDDVERGRRLD